MFMPAKSYDPTFADKSVLYTNTISAGLISYSSSFAKVNRKNGKGK